MVEGLESAQGFGIRDPVRLECATGGCEECRRNREGIGGAERGKEGGYLSTGLVATLREGGRRGFVESEVPQEALKVTADEDIHGRAQGFFDAGGMCSVECRKRRGLI